MGFELVDLRVHTMISTCTIEQIQPHTSIVSFIATPATILSSKHDMS